MRRSGLYFVFFAFAICFIAMTSQAQAQATRTWVSGVGDDANPCSRTAPCKTFPGAYSRTAVGGEIDALDPGGFGTITISKSITIDGGGGNVGQVASILASSTNAVVINGAAGDNISLRNLTINGITNSSFPGLNGIVFNSGGSLTLENINIMNFSQLCLNFQPASGASFTAINSTFVNCQGGGITVAAGSGTSRGNIEKSRIARNGFPGPGSGIKGLANSSINVHDTMISQNGAGGVTGGVDVNASTSNVSLDLCTIANNFGVGVHAGNSGILRMANSSVALNTGVGMFADTAGQILTWANNWVGGNGSDGGRTGLVPGGAQ